MEKEREWVIIVVVDVDPKDYEKGEKPKDENEEAKTKATMRPTRYTAIKQVWLGDKQTDEMLYFRARDLQSSLFIIYQVGG